MSQHNKTDTNYISKYILSQSSGANSYNDRNRQCLNKNQTGIKSSPKTTVDHVMQKIIDSAKRIVVADSQMNTDNRNTLQKNSNSSTNNDFLSFSQLQNGTKSTECNEFLNGSFNLDDNNLNIPKIDSQSQWTCDTQLISLVDNADAILNFFDSKNTSFNGDLDTKTDSKSTKNCDVFKKDDIFKMPLPKKKKSDMNIKSRETFIISRSQDNIKASESLDPLLFSQACGFKRASQKVIKISETAVDRVANLFDDLNNFQNVNDKPVISRSNNDFNSSSCLTDQPLDFREQLISGCNNYITDYSKSKSDTSTKETNSSVTNDKILDDDNIKINDSNIKVQHFSETCVADNRTCFNNKVVNLNDWENFFNNSINSSEVSNENDTQGNSDYESDNEITLSPILISQRVKTQDSVSENCVVDLNKALEKFDDSNQAHLFVGAKTNCVLLNDNNQKVLAKCFNINEPSLLENSDQIQLDTDSFSNIGDIDTSRLKCPNDTKNLLQLIQYNNHSLPEGNSSRLRNNQIELSESKQVLCSMDLKEMIGFKTASNKPINISEESINKYKNIFEDCYLDLNDFKEEFQIHEGNVQQKNSYKNNKTVRKCHLITGEHDSTEIKKNVSNDSATKRVQEESNRNANLRTIDNKEESVSQNAFIKAQTIFENPIVEDNSEFNNFERNLFGSQEKLSNGFKTASKKAIIISDKAMEKAKILFENIDDYESEFNTEFSCNFTNKNDNKFMDKDADVEIFSNEESTHELKVKLEGNEINLKKDKNKIENKDLSLKSTNTCIGFTINKPILDKALDKAESLSENISFETDCMITKNQYICGFKTASNKDITVSEISLLKTKSLFDNIDSSLPEIGKIEHKEESNSNIGFDLISDFSSKIDTKEFSGFTARQNKIINISENALNNAKLFKGESNLNVNCEFKDNFYKTSISKKNSGFKTANENHISVSENSLKKAKYIFEEAIDSSVQFNLKDDFYTPSTMKDFCGFTTASDKEITVSKNALKKARLMFEEDIHTNINCDSKNDLYKPSTSKYFSGYETSDSKQLTTSEKLLKDPTLICKEDNFSIKSETNNDCSMPSISKAFSCLTNETKNFKGFQTANNKTIEVSDEALNKAKFIFKEIETESKIFTQKCDDNVNTIQQEPGEFVGFLTAANKCIKISEYSLKKAKAIFYNIDKDEESLSSYPKESFCRFTTANIEKNDKSEDIKTLVDNLPSTLQKSISNYDSNVNVKRSLININNVDAFSDDAQSNNKDMMSNLDDENTNSFNINKGSFIGFSTASNKNITVSEEALSKARDVFQNLDNFDDHFLGVKQANVVEDHAKYSKFSTASNKPVNILEQNIDEAKKIFDDEFVENDIEKCIGFQAFVGFSTANKKKINISEEALNRAKHLLGDLNNDSFFDRKETCIDAKVKTQDKPEHQNEKLSSVVHESLSQEISESTKALLYDENKSILDNEKVSLIADDADAPSSPILPTKSRKVRKKNCDPNRTNIIKIRKIIDEFDKPNVDDFSEIDLGQLYQDKKENSNKMSLRDIVPCRKKNREEVLNISPDNFEQFIFTNNRVDVFVNDNKTYAVKVKDLADMFVKNKSVDTKLIPDKWIMNHLKWIIWKLASYERFNGDTFLNILTIGNVLKQLKYRYDKELFNAERPLMRKILECDDIPGKKMILCVSRIIKLQNDGKEAVQSPQYEVEVTDGWYSVLASIDHLLISAVERGKLTVGSKFITCGAELVNCGQGKSPLEDIGDVRLRLHSNSTVPAPWYSRLGPCCPPSLLRLPVSGLRPRAGSVPLLTFLPLVLYPHQYIEKLPSGDTITRSEKLEQMYLSSIEQDVQNQMEQLYMEAERDVMAGGGGGKKRVGVGGGGKGRKARGKDMDEEELLQMMEEASCTQDFMVSLCESQRQRVMDAMSRRQMEVRERVEGRVRVLMQERGVGGLNRKVVPTMKVRGLVLEREKGTKRVTPVVLTIWKTQDPTLDLLNKLQVVNIYWAVPTGTRMGELHLSTNKKTSFKEIKKKQFVEDFPDIVKYLRRCSSIAEMNQMSFAPPFNEVDTIGLVFKIEPSVMSNTSNNTLKSNLQMSPNMQTVYIADENKNFAAIHFWGGIIKYGYEKTIEVGKLLSCSNLQHRPRSSRKRFRNLYAMEYSTFSQFPRKQHLTESSRLLESKFKSFNVNEYVEECLKCLVEIAKTSLGANVSNHGNSLNGSTNNSYSSFSNTANNSSRLKRKLDLTDDYSLSGLDFESSFNEPGSSTVNGNQNVSANCSINTSTDVNQRIKKLKYYEEPPNLSPVAFNVSRTLRKEFVTPKKNLENILKTEENTFNIEDLKSSDSGKENFNNNLCDK